MNKTDRLIEIAMAEVGYKSNSRNRNLDVSGDGNGLYNKYARDLDKINYFNGKKNGYEWCAVFVAWCFYKLAGKENSQKALCLPDRSCGAGVKWLYVYGSRKSRITNIPHRGDVIILKSTNGATWQHTGIVEGLDDSTVYTIEGNNGKTVLHYSYAIDSPRIAGYLHPMWDSIPSEPIYYTVVKGDSLWKIAKTFYNSGIKYTEIKKANNLKSNTIKPGQKLLIPEL